MKILPAISLCVYSMMLFSRAVFSSPVMSSRLNQFEHQCIYEMHTSCNYNDEYFMSRYAVKTINYAYKNILSKKSILNAILKVRLLIKYPKNFKIYLLSAYPKLTWRMVPYYACPGCVDKYKAYVEHVSLSGNIKHEYLKIYVSQRVRVNPNLQPFISSSESIQRFSHSLKGVDVHDASVGEVFVRFRIGGKYKTYNLKSGDEKYFLLKPRLVNQNTPDYVVASTIRSWSDFSRAYSTREFGFVNSADTIKVFHNNSKLAKLNAIINYYRSLDLHYTVESGDLPHVSPKKTLISRAGDCKAMATLLQTLLKQNNIGSNIIALDENGVSPLSFDVPNGWGNHVILYIKFIHKYIDPTYVSSHSDWQDENGYNGFLGLNIGTGKFIVIH